MLLKLSVLGFYCSGMLFLKYYGFSKHLVYILDISKYV